MRAFGGALRALFPSALYWCMSLSPLLLLGAPPVVALAVGVWARGEARRDPARRRVLLRRAAILFGAGVVVAWGIWYVGPTNPESPAMLLTYFISWIIGGGMILLALALGIGAWAGLPKVSNN